MVRNMVTPVDSLNMGPWCHFFCCNMCSFIKSNAVWNTIIVDKAFYEFTDDNFGRSITCKEGQFIPE